MVQMIAFSNGLLALLDEEDFEWAGQLKWHLRPASQTARENWYAQTSVKRSDGRSTTVLMHRLIMKPPAGDPTLRRIRSPQFPKPSERSMKLAWFFLGFGAAHTIFSLVEKDYLSLTAAIVVIACGAGLLFLDRRAA